MVPGRFWRSKRSRWFGVVQNNEIFGFTAKRSDSCLLRPGRMDFEGRDAGVDVVAQCGGGCVCATCHVLVSPEWYDKLDPPGEEELVMLEESEEYVSGRSRLSCQLVCKVGLDGLEVSLMADSWEG
jgi:ferredoxin